jgi:plastocyanin
MKTAFGRMRAPLSLALVSLSLPAVAGCGGGSGSTATMSTEAASPSTQQVKVGMADFAFDPTPVSVATGGSVTWTNTDAAPHTATADDEKAFDTGTLQKGDSKTITLSKPGTYTYFCRFHPFMHGSVVVGGG